ncbi:MAG: NADPH-dependent F420 reductase [Actinomycetota bacterium]
MKIAILGAGMVGAALGKRFSQTGHEVYFGVPNPAEYDDKREFAKVGTVAEAAADSEIIVLAIPFDAISEAIENCGEVSGKIIVDCTNPLKMIDGRLSLALGFDTSGAEKVAAVANRAKVVKCFNQTGFDNLANPQYDIGKAVQFVCGDEPEARETVRKLAESIGFEAIDAGDLKNARLLEPLAALWIHLAFTTDLSRSFAFSLLRR